jgi:excisionase family DNA binding protein
MKRILLSELTTEELQIMIGDSVREVFQEQNLTEKKLKYLSRYEAAEYLDVSLPTLDDYTKSGKVKGYRLGKKIKYLESDLINAMNAIEPLKYRRG